MNNSFTQRSFRTGDNQPIYAAHWVHAYRFGDLLLIETAGKEHDRITEQITRLALHGPFNLIAGDEWLPNRDSLYRSVRRHTLDVEEALERPKLMRPMTCLQLLDLLMEADLQNRPTMILNFLHHFYNDDVELPLRDRVLEQCCQYVKRLSFSNSVVVLVPHLCTDDYKRFFPLLAAVANEVIPAQNPPEEKILQGTLF